MPTLSRPRMACRGAVGTGVVEVVVVDAACDRYGEFVTAAREWELGLHFCVDGRSAIRLARRFRADVWLVATELPDMAGTDVVDMVGAHGVRGDAGHRPGMFLVADAYRIEDEQRALASGVAGFLVHPVAIDVIRDASRLLARRCEPAVERDGDALIDVAAPRAAATPDPGHGPGSRSRRRSGVRSMIDTGPSSPRDDQRSMP